MNPFKPKVTYSDQLCRGYMLPTHTEMKEQSFPSSKNIKYFKVFKAEKLKHCMDDGRPPPSRALGRCPTSSTSLQCTQCTQCTMYTMLNTANSSDAPKC